MDPLVRNRIDSATLYQLVGAFRHRRSTDWTGWDRSVVLSLTVMLLGEFSFGISPSPEQAKDASGPYGLLVDLIKQMGAVRDETTDPDRAAEALLYEAAS